LFPYIGSDLKDLKKISVPALSQQILFLLAICTKLVGEGFQNCDKRGGERSDILKRVFGGKAKKQYICSHKNFFYE
jgi:hypothetical protein